MAAHAHERETASAVLHVGGLHYASEKAVVERKLGAQPGVLAVEANPVAQTANVVFDPAITSVEELEGERLERRVHGRDLGQDVDAVPIVLHHPLDPAHLALDAVEAVDEGPLVLAVAVFGHAIAP